MFKTCKWHILALNPCFDRNVYLQSSFQVGTLNRVSQTVVNYAGKGLNQAILAARHQQEIHYYSFGNKSEQLQEIAGLEHFSIYEQPCKAGIRTNMKVIDFQGVGTELNEKGGPFSKDEYQQLVDSFLSQEADIFTLGGSIPSGLSQDAYRELIKKIRCKYPKAVIALDCDGDALKQGLEGHPDFIKPNRRELAGLVGLEEKDLLSMEALLRCCEQVHQQYGTEIICTLDSDGAVYYGRDAKFQVGVVPVEEKGFSGAGDTFLSAFLTAKYAGGFQTGNALEYAARAAGAKVALEGSLLPTTEQIDALPKASLLSWS